MKRFWKILGITLGSLVGVVLAAVCIAVYVVFTPRRLTPIVRDVANRYIACPHEVGEVDLTFFSTFPEFGLRAKGLYLVNPMEGAQSDTLLAAPEVVARVNLMRFLKENTLEVHELSLDKAEANLFINADGQTNIDVFVLPEDTTEDTTAFSLPFERLLVERVSITAQQLSFLSLKDSIEARLLETGLTASADGLDDISLQLDCRSVSATLGSVQYADGLHLRLKAPHTSLRLDTLGITLRNTELSVNNFGLTLDGSADMQGEDIVLDAQLKTGTWDIPSLLSLLPQNILRLLDGIDIDAATAQLNASVKGVYNESLMPLVDATLKLDDGQAAYMEVFPYRLSDIRLLANAHLDLNEERNSAVSIRKLHARTGKTVLDATGSVSELLGDALCDLQAQADVNLPEFKRYLESNATYADLKGNATGTVGARIRLSALKNMQLSKGVICGNLNLTGLHVAYDSMLVDIPKTGLQFRIPNAKPSRPATGWLAATLTPESLAFEMIDQLKADMGKATIRLESNDILGTSSLLCAVADVDATMLTAALDSMGGTLQQPRLKAYAEYDTKAADAIPTVEADLAFNDLQGYYEDINAHLTQSQLTASLSGTRKDKSQPRAKVTLRTGSVKASVGDDVKAQTGLLSLTANARRDPSKENLLLQWNPRLNISLTDGSADLKAFSEHIEIPQITFDYSNKVFNIAESRLNIGNSDFSLQGQVRNIGPWLDKKGNLQGELTFSSRHTDVNELMALFSADSGTEETPQEAEAAKTDDDKEANPFLVPKDVDLTLVTDIREAVVFDQLARDLGGKLYVKDGVLVLEEMGFICNAAKLQLTAMYKTPRRNHIYAGLDYHMVDINIQELVNMIPQIDTLMPMLRSFRGNGEFHLAAETFLTAKYDPKWSTARGAVSITGKDLVLLDSETFGKIAKILMFNRKTENLVDSISVQATLFKKEMDIYPFCMTMDKYMAAVGGRHNLDMSFNYHVSLLKPLYIGVDVSGTLDDLKIRPAKCRYAQDFRPIIRRDVETQNASLKKLINAALKRNVTIQSEQ